MLDSRTKKTAIIVLVLVLICFALFITFYYLSFLVTTLGSFIIFVFFTWFMLRKAVHILVFPGSTWFWLRAIEYGFCQDLCSKLLSKVSRLRVYLESIKTQDYNKFDYSTMTLIIKVTEVLHSIQLSSKLSLNQSHFYSLLYKLKNDLSQTNIIVNSTENKNMWDWLQAKEPTKNIVYEDYPECHQAKLLIEDCLFIETRLKKTLNPVNFLKQVRRWMTEDLVGNIEYLREDLKKRFNCEQFWVGDSKKIDCMYIALNPDRPTMIYCNPNAGYYEFSFYRSEWFEFYYELGINLVLWNYRGYGRSQGSPSLKQLINDGEEIFKYLRTNKSAKIIGIHGESLGGCISTYLADKCLANFLFADRTFSSLSKAAYYNFGKLAYYGFRLSCSEDIDSSSHFLSTKCYKVLSSDFNDSMIKDMGSLKSGVALKLLYSRFPNSHILNDDQTLSLLNTLKRVSDLNEHLSIITTDLWKSTGYQVLQEDLEIFDNERCKEVVLKLKNLLNTLEAGGCTLIQTINCRSPLQALVNWLLIFDIWGTSLYLSKKSPSAAAVHFISIAINELELLKDVNQMSKEINIIQSSLDIIKSHIESRIDQPDTKSLFTSQDFKQEIDYETAGWLLTLNCGHSGPYSTFEKLRYKRHLIKANFIK